MLVEQCGIPVGLCRYHEVREEPGAETSEGGDPESLSEAAARLDAIPVAHSCHMCTFGCSQAHDLAQHIASAHPAEPVFRSVFVFFGRRIKLRPWLDDCDGTLQICLKSIAKDRKSVV